LNGDGRVQFGHQGRSPNWDKAQQKEMKREINFLNEAQLENELGNVSLNIKGLQRETK
jgi:hypothetical protein